MLIVLFGYWIIGLFIYILSMLSIPIDSVERKNMKEVEITSMMWFCKDCGRLMDGDSYDVHNSSHNITKVEVSTENSIAKVLRDMLVELRRLNDNFDRVSVSDHGAILTKRDE